MTRGASGRRGFTILELLLFLFVLSLLAAITVRYYFSRAEVTLENAAILLARDLRAAQHRSIFLAEPSHVVFLPEGDGYVVTDALGALAKNPQTDQIFERLYPRDGVFKGVVVLEAAAGDDRTLVIDLRGLPTEELQVTLGYQDERRKILMDRTGRLAIEGSTSGWVDDDS